MRFIKLFLFFMPSVVFAQQMNELTKVFFHQSSINDKLVCYFTNDPICNRLPSKESDKEGQKTTLQFFMPMTVEGTEAKTNIKKIQGVKHNAYSFTFNEVTKPIKGINLTITYDPKQIVCNYEAFDAINTYKGIVFSFHNKEALQTLKFKTDGLLQYACNRPSQKSRIMLDYGHGGSDDGKVGCFGVKEKNVNLEVGQKVARLLSKQGYEVFSTRTNDSFVALDERTKYANQKNVDLFVSIHANASVKPEIQGVETYWINYDLFKPSMTLSDSNVGKILTAIKHDQSMRSQALAQSIHHHVITATKKIHAVVDRKVKQSIAQVLLGPQMPSALIEIGFLSNPDETKLLIDQHYQQIVAQGIAAVSSLI